MSEELKDKIEEIEGQEKPETPENKTYTQAELDALLQSEVDRRMTMLQKKMEKKNQEKVKEAEKLAKLSEQERFEYELEKREKAIAEKERQMALMENKAEASKALSERGISIALVDMVVAEDADTMMENIKTLETEFKKSVKEEVEKRLSTTTPKKNLAPDGTITKESFRAMKLTDQAKLFEENPALYKQLTS